MVETNSDKLTRLLQDNLNEALGDLDKELSEQTLTSIVHAVLKASFGCDSYSGFSCGYGREAREFNTWFTSLPGIWVQVESWVASALTPEALEKLRLAGMKKLIGHFARRSEDSYDRRKRLEPVRAVFAEYARIRARADAKAIYDAARDAAVQQIEAKKSTPEATKKSPSKRKKSCPNTDDVVQDS